MRAWYWGSLVVTMAGLLFFALVPRAVACSPIPPEPGVPTPVPPTRADLLQAATTVFEGEVVALTEDRIITTIRVARYFKGEGPGRVALNGFGWGSDCLPVTEVGQEFIVYATGDPQTEVSLLTTEALSAAPELIALTGQEPIEVPASSGWLAPLVGFTVVGLAILALLARRDRQRTPRP